MTKISQLISQWPRGTVFTASYLGKEGFSSDLLSRYKSSRQIEPVAHGAYKLPSDKVDWFGALYALQSQLGLTIHAGGKTALELKGCAHYLPDKANKIFLFGQRSERLPKWFTSSDWEVYISYSGIKLFPSTDPKSLSEYHHKNFVIKISSPELGALEMLYHVPDEQGFDEAFLIMQNLASLRPTLVQQLLEQCTSIKVKRLFMSMADKLKHPWVKRLDLTKVDLGSGKRVIVKDGILDKQYDITVSDIMVIEDESD